MTARQRRANRRRQIQAVRTMPWFKRVNGYLLVCTFTSPSHGRLRCEVWRDEEPGSLWGYCITELDRPADASSEGEFLSLSGHSEPPLDAVSFRYARLLDAACRGYDEVGAYVSDLPPWPEHARWVQRCMQQNAADEARRAEGLRDDPECDSGM